MMRMRGAGLLGGALLCSLPSWVQAEEGTGASSVHGASSVRGASSVHGAGPTAAVRPQPDCRSERPFWLRTVQPRAAGYCHLVHRAQARLWSDAKEARALADKALQVFPGGRSARLVRSQCLVLLGEFEQAHQQFSELLDGSGAEGDGSQRHSAARSREERGSWEWSAPQLVSAARAALLSGDYPAALSRYRPVVLRLEELHGPREQARLLIEAATAAAYAGPAHGRETRAYLAAARERNAPVLEPLVASAWGLSLYRDGDKERAARVLSSFETSWRVHWVFSEGAPAVGRPGELLPVLPKGEGFALAAVIAEAVEPDASSLHWDEFRETGGERIPAHILEATGR